MKGSVKVLARITAKGQVTIPRDVREALDARPGDTIAWEVDAEGGVATVRRVRPVDIEYLRAIESTLDEWAGPEDEEAYRDL